jgi:hypothetical protein
MSGFYPYYSTAEIGRVVDYIRTLPVEVKVYDVPGESPPDGGTGTDGP